MILIPQSILKKAPEAAHLGIPRHASSASNSDEAATITAEAGVLAKVDYRISAAQAAAETAPLDGSVYKPSGYL